jgi:hypothetical protein
VKWWWHRERSDLEAENARLRQALALAGVLVWYYHGTRTAVVCNHAPRHTWRTRRCTPAAVADRPTEATPR